MLVGLDVIGDYVTEINVTSPTGMRVMNRMYDLDLATLFWDAAEKLLVKD
jgi:glutathione synthase